MRSRETTGEGARAGLRERLQVRSEHVVGAAGVYAATERRHNGVADHVVGAVAANVDAAVRTLAGSARSMGITVEGL